MKNDLEFRTKRSWWLPLWSYAVDFPQSRLIVWSPKTRVKRLFHTLHVYEKLTHWGCQTEWRLRGKVLVSFCRGRGFNPRLKTKQFFLPYLLHIYMYNVRTKHSFDFNIANISKYLVKQWFSWIHARNRFKEKNKLCSTIRTVDFMNSNIGWYPMYTRIIGRNFRYNL